MIEKTQRRSYSEKRIKVLEKVGFQKQVEKLRKDNSNSNRYREIKHLEKNKSLKSIRSISKEKLKERSGHFLEPTKIISLTAHKWAIFDYFSGKYIRGYRAHDPHELSSFSKLLVFCTINTLVNKHKLDISRFQTIVTPSVLKHYRNTSINIDDIITLEHLLYLMLMNEGEEYELVAALNIGAYLEKKRKKEYYSVYDADDKSFKVHIKQFYDFVNSYCQTMSLENISYVEFEPSLRKQRNKCSAFDLASLSLECLKIPLFNKILNQNEAKIEIKYIDDSGVLASKVMKVQNATVKNQFISYFNVCRNFEENQFMNSHCSVFYEMPGIRPVVIVILGSYSPNDREKDIQQLIQWYLKSCEKNTKIKEIEKVGQNKTEEDPEEIFEAAKKPHVRFRTELTQQLDVILEEKLKTNPSKHDYRIKGVSKAQQKKKRTITQINY